jgi:hypothetical protein
MNLGRRDIVQAGAAAAAAAPFLKANPADAAIGAQAMGGRFRSSAAAPVITIFDHRGCTAHANKEYTGSKTGNQDDEMLVKVQMQVIPKSESRAIAQYLESIGFKEKGIDGPRATALKLDQGLRPGANY